MIHNTNWEHWDDGNSKKNIHLVFWDIEDSQGNLLSLYDGDIYGESMSLQECLFDGNGALSVIGCVSSKFSIDIRMDKVRPYNLKNTRIYVNFRTENDYWMNIFNGYVYSVDTTRTENIVHLECYDALSHFADINVYPVFRAFGQSSFSFKALLNALTAYVGLFYHDMYDDYGLRDVFFENKLEGTEIAFLDVIRAMAQFTGRFCLINRDGLLEFRDLTLWSEGEIYPADDLFPGAEIYPANGNHVELNAYKSVNYEDYMVQKISKVTLRENDGDENTKIAGEGDNNYLVENVLVKCIHVENRQQVADNIYNHVKDLTYMPFEAVVQGRPYMEVGDAITLNVYDYINGSQVSNLMLFTILNRTLKGIQWLEDTYSATGTELQPLVKIGGDKLVDMQKDISSIKSDVSDIKSDISDLQDGKQNFIDLDILPPERDGQEGDLVFSGGLGSGIKTLWRYENNAWVAVNIMNITMSTLDIEPGVTDLEDGALYLVYE